METQAIIGLVILAIAAGTFLKIIGNITKAIILIGLILMGSTLFIGGTPELGNLPLVGRFFPQVDLSAGGILQMAKGMAWSVDIVGAGKDSEGTMAILVANTGQFDISEVQVQVNGQSVTVTNRPKLPLEKDQTTIVDTDFKGEGEVEIKVSTGKAEKTFKTTV